MKDTNPVVTQAASATAFLVVIKALLTYAKVMGWLDLEEDKFQATVSLVETLIPIIAVWVGAIWAMRKVTPLTNPKDVDNTPLTRPDNSPAIPQMAVMQKEAIKINEEIDERKIVR